MKNKRAFFILILVVFVFSLYAQQKKIAAHSKQISPDLFGIFFEDINYAADGGLYAELIQNRSFEYSPSDHSNWNAFTSWEYITQGYGYGTISIETLSPVHPNNPHYVVLNVEEEGSEGIGLKNSGFDGIVIKAGEKYNFSVFLRRLSGKEIPIEIKLLDRKGIVIGTSSLVTESKDWKKYSAIITATQSDDSCSLVILAKAKGKLAVDMVSLFPQKTFKNRNNGLRADLAQTIANLKPKFMRFPGGCLVHGDGLGNMYRWKNTIGPVEQRTEQKDIWNYHQTAGLGYFEFFQFCEDIGAKPLPVVPAAVCCQNSGGTWRIGGTGQRGIALDNMPDYIQEVLDLIEWANGSITSTWGAKRAEAGHPQPFNLEYIGIGNEDKITPVFKERFKVIYDAVKLKYPEIKIIGTVGPAPSGEDYDLGWQFANQQNIQMVDEHYYEKPEWFIDHQKRYDSYNRSQSKVYIGEYASWGNKLFNAIAEAAYMTSLERNGDVVRLASYAPMLAKIGHTQWNPDMIYFNNTTICPSVNYYVQQLFSLNQGDEYFSNIISWGDATKNELASSCVRDAKTGDIIIKLVNTDSVPALAKVNLSDFKYINSNASCTVLSGNPKDENTFKNIENIIPKTTAFTAGRLFIYNTPAYSLTVIRIKTKNNH